MNHEPDHLPRRGWVFQTAFWIFALLAFCLAAGGIWLLVMIVPLWITHGYSFSYSWASLDRAVALLAAGGLLTALVITGVLLRLSAWRQAQQASLALGLVSLMLLASFYWLLAPETGQDPLGDWTMFNLSAAAALALVSLPPFCHWLGVRRKIR